MAVETRYVVIRTGKNDEEQEVMTFTDKRSADDHDKMLDMADALFEVLHASSVELPEQQCEELSIYLAKQRDDILFALQAKKKATTPSAKKKEKANEKQNDMLNPDENDISPKSLSETLLADSTASDDKKDKSNNEESIKDDNLVDFVIEKDDAAWTPEINPYKGRSVNFYSTIIALWSFIVLLGAVVNKSVLTNLIALVSCVVGWQLDIDWLFTMAMFALSGALTNWLAVHMLFEKIPGLYGSGIIQIKFEQFKSGIRTLIMDQFFTQENLDKFMAEQSGAAHHFDLEPIIADTDLTPAFDSLVTTIKASSFGSMLGMFGGDEALEPLKQPFTDNLKASVIEISKSDEFAEKLKSNISSDQNIDAMLTKVDSIVQQRLDELTPKMVKDIIQEMIKSHLGWLVVWGGFFGGAIGLIAHLSGI